MRLVIRAANCFSVALFANALVGLHSPVAAFTRETRLAKSTATPFILAQAPSKSQELEQLARKLEESKIKAKKLAADSAKKMEGAIREFQQNISRFTEGIKKDGCNEQDRRRFYAEILEPMVKAMELKLQIVQLKIEQAKLDPSGVDGLNEEQSGLRRLGRVVAIAQLDFADAALARKCLDWADEVYRRLATTEKDTAILRRAMIGVDDVRAARYR